ncbi:hypothetical protein [Wenzhouxiangella sediminis]|uniref:Uncharacterized protein n=1 Tax=Wenzhouxiangella sediminis TaxID=1792836 RepID=A0A3E1K8Z0_9GAMM|nr:hypothetical protein [Wenzhouxiangella sediminis]RFF30581.1 hypothetical protein DZC52_07580 [Wenzhouxiangella sediminis]
MNFEGFTLWMAGSLAITFVSFLIAYVILKGALKNRSIGRALFGFFVSWLGTTIFRMNNPLLATDLEGTAITGLTAVISAVFSSLVIFLIDKIPPENL